MGMGGAGGCDCRLLAFLPSTYFIYLTFDPEGQTSVFCFYGPTPNLLSTACLIGRKLPLLLASDSLFIFWTLSYLSASSQLTSDFVSKFIYALFARFPI